MAPGEAPAAPAAAAAAAAQQLPAAQFIDDVGAFMAGQRVEVVFAELEAQLRAFKQREQALLARRSRLRERLPEIKLALEAVLGLLARRDGSGTDGSSGSGSAQPLLVDFELTEGVHARAALGDDVDAVNLWLGANVMVEYPLAEARSLLQEQQRAAEGQLSALDAELTAVKGALATTEVSMARVFNWDVEQRRKAKAAGGAGSS